MSDQNSVMVPVEPTKAMIKAGCVEMFDRYGIVAQSEEYTGHIYRAMIAAAPVVSAPAALGVEGEIDKAMVKRAFDAYWAEPLVDPNKRILRALESAALRQRSPSAESRCVTCLRHESKCDCDDFIAAIAPGAPEHVTVLRQMLIACRDPACTRAMQASIAALTDTPAPPTGLSAEEMEALEWCDPSAVKMLQDEGLDTTAGHLAIIAAGLRRCTAQPDAPKPEVNPEDRDYLDDAIAYFNGLGPTPAGLNLAGALIRVQAALGSKE